MPPPPTFKIQIKETPQDNKAYYKNKSIITLKYDAKKSFQGRIWDRDYGSEALIGTLYVYGVIPQTAKHLRPSEIPYLDRIFVSLTTKAVKKGYDIKVNGEHSCRELGMVELKCGDTMELFGNNTSIAKRKYKIVDAWREWRNQV